ncbi:MAG: hypothetical protein IJ532_08315 [Alphaproteobacteria bacterium]|nr:hypothetical protein [Alphaproteobacteria bacterium]
MKYKSPLGYEIGDDGVDSYGVNHRGFSTRDELEYQAALQQREQQLMQNYNSQGITQDYPQYGTNFWGDNTDNNYGFGSSNISGNVKGIMEQLNGINYTIAPDYTISPAGAIENNNSVGTGSVQNLTPQSNDVNAIRQRIFNGYDCGGMNAEFADKIAYAESRGGCRDNINDYGCVNSSETAFGRYQMQKPALIDAGYMNRKGKFLPKTGIKNMQEFLNNPEAQEQATCNYLDRIDMYNKNWNNYKYLGDNIQVGELNIPITKDMMLAGTHREGARKLNEWLNDARIKNHQLVRNPVYDRQDEKKRNITKRFEEILYPPK